MTDRASALPTNSLALDGVACHHSEAMTDRASALPTNPLALDRVACHHSEAP